MRIITVKRLREFWAKHEQAEIALKSWRDVVRKSDWKSFADVRVTYPSADLVGKCIVFNVGGNNIRLAAGVHYQRREKDGSWTMGRVYIRNVLTHSEYDRGSWKKNCGAK